MPFQSRFLLLVQRANQHVQRFNEFYTWKQNAGVFFWGGGRTPHFASVFLVSFLSLLVEKEADAFPLYREESEERSFLVKNTRLCEKTHMTLFNF